MKNLCSKYLNPIAVLISFILMILVSYSERLLPSTLSIFLAPAIEETSKFLVLIILGIPGSITYTFIFSIIEFSGYIRYFIFMTGTITLDFVVLRLLVVCIHFVFLGAQLAGYNLYMRTKSKIYLLLGLIAAILLHLSWNTGGILNLFR